MSATEIRDARIRVREAVEEARLFDQTDRRRAEAILEGPVIRLADALIRRRCRQLPAAVDFEDIRSRAIEVVWRSIGRVQLEMDTGQIVRFFSTKAEHAVSDASREADPLPRRVRGYRKLVLASLFAQGLPITQPVLAQVAAAMFPGATRRTLEMIAFGAPPVVNAERDDLAAVIVADETTDPEARVVSALSVDALHMAMADCQDPSLRAWAATVLCDENDGRRVPVSLAAALSATRDEFADALS
jgi:hypothetical protein